MQRLFKRTGLKCTVISLLSALFLIGCGANTIKGNGKVTTQARQVKHFDEVKIAGNFVVHLNASQSSTGVQVKTDENIQPYIVTEVQDNKLVIKNKKGYSLHPSSTIQVSVNAKKIDKVEQNGTTTLIGSGLVGDNFELKVTGTGTSVLNGAMKSVKYKMEGTSHLNASALKAEAVDIDIMGTAQASVMASKKLNVHIKGNARVTFYGNPQEVDQEIYGGGKLVKG